MDSVTLKVSGMTCMGCVNSVKRLLSAIEGVGQVEVDLALGRVTIGYDPAQAGLDALKNVIEGGGYQVID